MNLNPKKLFCLDLGLGRPLALSFGQLPDKVTGLPWIPSVLEVLGLGFDLALSGEEEDKEARIAQMLSPTLA